MLSLTICFVGTIWNQIKLEFNLNDSKDINRGLIITSNHEFFLGIPSQFELISIDEFELFLDYSPISLIDYVIKSKISVEANKEPSSNYIIWLQKDLVTV